jgi:hypothetical protein
LLDPAPLPDLLVKHLGLSPDQGVRIMNVHNGSPADKAGLERDDIIIGFQGEDVRDYEKFVGAVRKAGAGTEVSLEIIHLGKRKTVNFKLEAFKGDFDLKYPPEPEIMQWWRPGKIFRLKPGEKDWMEILGDNVILKEGVPPEIRVNLNRFFKDLYTFQHSVDGETYTITIEGNPDDEDTVIIVRMDDTEYKTTLDKIDELPEKYREAAEQALKEARKSSRERKLTGKISIPRPEAWIPPLEDKLHHYYHYQFGPGDQMFDKIQKQMSELKQRIEELEERLRGASEPFLEEKKSRQEQESDQPEKKDEQRA